jgi:hypothetical protein
MTWSDIFAHPGEQKRLEWGSRTMRFAASSDTIGLLSFDRIDEWIRYGQVRYPQFQVNLPGGGVPPNLFTVTRPYLALVMPGYPDTEAISAQLKNGATLRFVNIEDFYAPVADLCARLTTLLGAVVNTYAFYTPPGDDGVGAHFDNADVFALQVEGTKTWHLWDIPEGVAWQATQTLPADADPDHVLELRPGDGLYIPAGTGHRAFAGPQGSLHLSITVKPTSHHDIIRRWTEDFLATVPLLDRLPIDGDRAAPVAELLAKMALAAERTDPAELLAEADHHRPKLSDAPLIAGARPGGTTRPHA